MALSLNLVVFRTKYVFFKIGDSGLDVPTPAGEVCLNDAAHGIGVVSQSNRFNDFSRSNTKFQAFIASNTLIYPGLPFNTLNGKSTLSIDQIPACF